VIIDNYPDGQVENLDAINNPEDLKMGSRKIPFSRTIYIEQDDFKEIPPKKYFRLSPGQEVRLKHAYIIKCVDFRKDSSGNITELHCIYDPATRSGETADGRKVKSTLHWVSADHAVSADVRLYDHLFTKPDPDDVPEGSDFTEFINPNSLELLRDCKLEPGLASVKPGDRMQFLRHGYFCVDLNSKPGALIFNRAVSLKDSWARIEKSSA
jgi:glutaminyl-tRNA synthetase